MDELVLDDGYRSLIDLIQSPGWKRLLYQIEVMNKADTNSALNNKSIPEFERGHFAGRVFGRESLINYINLEITKIESKSYSEEEEQEGE